MASGEDPTDPFADLDPDISCRPKDKIRAGSLKPCKPNCRGGKVYNIYRKEATSFAMQCYLAYNIRG